MDATKHPVSTAAATLSNSHRSLLDLQEQWPSWGVGTVYRKNRETSPPAAWMLDSSIDIKEKEGGKSNIPRKISPKCLQRIPFEKMFELCVVCCPCWKIPMRIAPIIIGYCYKDCALCRAFYYLFHYSNNNKNLFFLNQNGITIMN